MNSDCQVKLIRPIVLLLGLFLCQSAAAAAMNGAVRGRVFDARDGEPLARVDVQLGLASNQTITDDEGRFSFTSVQAGDYVLRVSTVGYSLLKKNLRLSPGEVQDFEIVLSPDTGRRTDSVNVVSGPFEISRQDNPSEMALRGSEIKNVSTILCNDPLRAIQELPGVASNNDFQSRFSLRGADFNRIGFYLDDVLLHSPFHEVQGDPNSGSVTIVNGDTLDGIELEKSAFSVRYADSTAGVVDARTREGNRVQPTVRATASLASASVLAEGPLGHERKGDWLVSVRRSYLDAVLRRAVTDPSLAFGFFDLQGSVGYDLNPKNHLSLSVVDGSSNLDRTGERNSVGELGVLTGDNHFTVANLGWRYTPHDHFLLTNRSAYLREKFKNFNRDALPLLGGYYTEWVGSTKGTWLWSKNANLDFGASLRWIRTDGYLNFPFFNPFANQIILAQLDNFQGTGLREGGFVQQSWKARGGRILLTGGVRWDRHSVDQVSAASPQASVAFLLRPTTRLNLGWGQYLQYPEMQDFLAFPFTNSRHLLPERSTHFVAALEQRIDERTRARVEFYQRQDRDLLFQPFYEPRLTQTGAVFTQFNPALRNSVRGTSRGVEAFLERRSANRLTGWISYAYGHTRLREGYAGIIFPSDRDQLHTANVYLGYRLRPSVNLSLKGLYGSGFPIPGFYRRSGDLYFLSPSRNALRLGPYERVDFRADKAYTFERWKLTLYGEVINVLNHHNTRFEGFNTFDLQTGQAFLVFGRLVPILPSAGLALEF